MVNTCNSHVLACIQSTRRGSRLELLGTSWQSGVDLENLHFWQVPVAKPKFVCLVHTVSPNKPNWGGLEQRKSLSQGLSKENRLLELKKVQTLKSFYLQNVKGRAARCVIFPCNSVVMFQESQSLDFWSQPVWYPELVLCLKLPSSTWMGS